MPTQGEIIQGRYRAVRLLGRGGFGAVYLGEDLRLGRQIALKIMRLDQLPTDEQAAAQRYEQEALLLAQLNHPNLVRVWDYVQGDDYACVVMEYIPGETLRERLNRQGGPLPVPFVVACGLQLCDVLGYLHDQSPPIIFRDLKPANVIVLPHTSMTYGVESPIIKLIDFGIARFFKADRTSDTQVIGTPGYAAPEQYGQGQTDARSDIYSLGVTLHCLLSGHAPASMLPPAVDELAATVPPALVEVIARATAFDPAARYPDVTALRRDLLACLPQPTATEKPASTELSAVPSTLQPRSRPSLPPPAAPMRPRAVGALPLFLMLAGMLLGGLFLSGGLRAWQRTPAPNEVAAEPTDARPLAPTSVPLDDRAMEWLLPDAPGRIAFGQRTANGGYDLLATSLDGQPVRPLRSGGTNISPSWSPDGARIAFTSEDDDGNLALFIGAVAENRFQQVSPPSLSARYPAWSPDGSRLAFAFQSDTRDPWQLAVVELESGSVARLGPSNISWISWSSQGNLVYSGRAEGGQQDIFMLNDDGVSRNLTRTRDYEEDFPEWSADGQHLAFVAYPVGAQNLSLRHIYVMDSSGNDRTQVTHGPGPHTNPVWSPDGHWIAYLSKAAGGDWQVWAQEATSSTLRQLTFGGEQKFYLAWGRS